MTVAVVGAGITGLTAAYLLRKQGIPVTVFEAGASEGGLAGTFRIGPFGFDFGPHELCTDNPALEALLQEICEDDLLRVEKRTAQHFNGSYVRYPFEIVDVVRSISPLLSLRALAEVAAARVRNAFAPPKDSSFHDWTCARFGRTMYRIYFGPYTEKVWGVDPSLLDPRTASQRITVDSVWDLLKKTLRYQVLRADDFANPHSEFRRQFYYVRNGIGALQGHLRQKLEAAGCRFEFGKKLARVRCAGERAVQLGFADGTRRGGFDYVLSTIPLPILVRLALGEARARPVLQRNELPFRGMSFVFLALNKPKLHDFHWIYYPDRAIPFQRLTEFSHFGAGMEPPGKTGVTIEVSCTPGDATWNLSDQATVQRCVDSLVELGHLRPDEVLEARVVRVTHAYPLQISGFLEKSQALLDSIAHVRNLVSIGRQGLFRYCNMNECMEMALEVAPRMIAGHRGIRYTREGTWKGVGVTDRHASKEGVQELVRSWREVG